MEAGVQVVEEGVLWILLTGVGVGEHSFASLLSQVPAESGQLYLTVVIEVVRHVGGTGTGLVDGLVGRVEVEERFLSRVFFRLAVVPVQDDAPCSSLWLKRISSSSSILARLPVPKVTESLPLRLTE